MALTRHAPRNARALLHGLSEDAGIGRFAARLAVFAMATLALTSVASAARPQQSALVIDANTGAVISAQAADEPRYPASLTKMMTLYIVFDLVEQGRLNYQSRIPISEAAAGQSPSKLGLEAGADIALIDAVKALITKSANDIAVALAEKIAGSEEKFAALMTQKARAIGMKATTFKNASGLPNDQQVTTARDMVTLALRLHDDFPKHYPLFATREFRYGNSTHANHNTLLGRYEGTEGIKTGYTRVSGFNLVASVKRGQKHVVGAVFGGATAGSRNQTMRTLLNIAILKASTHRTRPVTSAVARHRAAPEPKVAERPATRPAPVALARAPARSPATPSEAVALPAPIEPAPAPASSAGKIEIAKVRPILVAPRTPAVADQQRPVPAATAEPNALANLNMPALAAAAERPDLVQPQRSAKAAPASMPANAALVPAVRAPSPRPAAVPAAAPAVPLSPIARGTPPGTLGQQAAALTGGASAAPIEPAAGRMSAGVTSVAPPPVAASGSYQIQVGAFASAAEAERQLYAIRQRAGDVVGNAAMSPQAADAAGKKVWRARFTGFESAAATQACTELRRRQIDCLVTKAQ